MAGLLKNLVVIMIMVVGSGYVSGEPVFPFYSNRQPNQGNPEPRLNKLRLVHRIWDQFQDQYYKTLQPETVQPAEPCPDHPGTVFLEGKCLLLVNEPSSVEGAKAKCVEEGGELYRHNVDNPFLTEYLFKFFPEYFDAKHEIVWTVFKTSDDGTSILDTSMEDEVLPPTPLLLREKYDPPFNGGECVYFEHHAGVLLPQSESCDFKASFVCQFESADATRVQYLW